MRWKATLEQKHAIAVTEEAITFADGVGLAGEGSFRPDYRLDNRCWM